MTLFLSSDNREIRYHLNWALSNLVLDRTSLISGQVMMMDNVHNNYHIYDKHNRQNI